MKKTTVVLFLIASIGFFSFNLSAQQNFVYDGTTFNVWLKTNTANTQVLEVYFSADGKWNKFSIVDYESFDDTNDGFAFKVKDGRGRMYWVDYFRNEVYIKVSDETDGETWTLNRRNE